MAGDKLTLVKGWVDGCVPDEKGGAEEADFGVVVTEGGARQRYKLVAMTHERYDGWFLETRAEHELAQGERPPLIIPAEYCAIRGLVNHVLETYLNSDDPHAINMIAAHLEVAYFSGCYPAVSRAVRLTRGWHSAIVSAET